MGKAYLCPHCGARNKLAGDAPDGVVRCASCGQAFLLPDAKPRRGMRDPVDTAIVDNRGGGPSPFDGRDTEIVDMRGQHDVRDVQQLPTYIRPVEGPMPAPPPRMPAPTHPAHVKRDAGARPRVPGSEKPTLMVGEGAARNRLPGSERPTLMVDDARQETVTRPAESPAPAPPPVPAPPPSEAAAEERAATVRGLDEPGERPRPSASTQPTNPPAEYRSSADAAARRGMPTTQPTSPGKVQSSRTSMGTVKGAETIAPPQAGGGGLLLYFAGVILISGIIYVAFHILGTQGLDAIETQATARAKAFGEARTLTVASAIKAHMLAGRPDLARGLLTELGKGPAELGTTAVVRPDRTPAFLEGDWSTYRRVGERVCDADALKRRFRDGPEVALRLRSLWLQGGDQRMAALGDDPCAKLASKPDSPPEAGLEALPEDIADRFVGDGRQVVSSWIEGSPGERQQVSVRPIRAGEQCKACHEGSKADDGLLGLVVVRSPLGEVDTVLTDKRRTAIVVGAVVAGIALLLLIVLGVMTRRRGAR